MPDSPFDVVRPFDAGSGRAGRLFSLPALEAAGGGAVSRLPVCLRIVLESVLRHCDGTRIRERDVRALAAWKPAGARAEEIPFTVSRILLQDFTGVPLLVDLAAMRSAVARLGRDPRLIEPSVPVDLVVDHSVQVDVWSRPDALRRNVEQEFHRNRERYEFLKWGAQAFETLRIVPPGVGIVHQVNLEFLAAGVMERDGLFFPDTLVGTDSHTTMINGMGIVGWGVGGIEAEAAMLGEPVYLLMPDVVGVHLTGSLEPGVTATDLALDVTQRLRAAKVVGAFVEFHGEGASSLPLPDRATVANMAPEYGATMGYFPPDDETCRYLAATGRAPGLVEAFRNYCAAQGLFGIPRGGECDYTRVIDLDLGSVRPSVAGPRRPQDRVELGALKRRFAEVLAAPVADGGYGRGASARSGAVGGAAALRDGDVLIAAITSCTNTSNPGVMFAAGLLAKKAVERGLTVPAHVKCSLAPGSRVVTDYLRRAGLQEHLDRLGFHLVGYGCTTCIGNSGPLAPEIEKALSESDVIAASVLSGNRNFEARVHQALRANFLMSPPLVVAFALAGRVDVDMTSEPLGAGRDGRAVFLRDLWPGPAEIRDALEAASGPEAYRSLYSDLAEGVPFWSDIASARGVIYNWDEASTYIQEPPFLSDFRMAPDPVEPVRGARALAILGDSVTTDHISPAGAIRADSPAGRFLVGRGVTPAEFNSYGARRGNDRVMTRGTFANVRIRNLMVAGAEGGVTVHHPSGEGMAIHDAAARYAGERIPLLIFAGTEYGTGSSRDWAAKGTRLLGVRAVIAAGFERIHRSNLVGMGVLPCQFPEGTDARSLELDGSETFDLAGHEEASGPGAPVTLTIRRAGRPPETVPLILRLDTATEVEYYRHGGILPCIVRRMLDGSR
jgi:aconitate hydratase